QPRQLRRAFACDKGKCPDAREDFMTMAFRALVGACAIAALTTGASAQTTLTIATVNNSDMVRMQGLTDDFTKAHPDIKLEWVTLEENVLRQNVTQDIATGGGQYDV